jgi:hypothetical protein
MYIVVRKGGSTKFFYSSTWMTKIFSVFLLLYYYFSYLPCVSIFIWFYNNIIIFRWNGEVKQWIFCISPLYIITTRKLNFIIFFIIYFFII